MSKTDRRTAGRVSETAGPRQETSHRQLKIIAGMQNGRALAIAYRGGKIFLQAEGLEVPLAIAELRSVIDRLHEEREARRTNGLPSAEEYADALLRVDRFINPVQQTALFRHAGRPGSRVTLPDLARQVGASVDVLQRGYANLGRYLGNVLNFHPQIEGLRKPLQPLLVLAQPDDSTSDDTVWKLRDNLVSALADD